MRVALWGLLLTVLAALIGPVQAQVETTAAITITLPDGLDPAVRAEVLEALGAAGATIDEPAAAPSGGWQQDYAEELDRAIIASATVPVLLAHYWQQVGGLMGLLAVLGCIALGLVVWAVTERRLAPAGAKQGDGATLARPRFRVRLARAARYAASDAGAIMAFLAVSFAAGYVLLPDAPPAPRLTLTGVTQLVATGLVLVALVRAVVNPASTAARLAPLANDEARLVWRAALLAIAVSIPVTVYQSLVVTLAVTTEQVALTVIAVEAIATAVRIWLFWTIRKPMQGLIEHSFGNGRGRPQPAVVGALARSWHLVFSLFALARLAGVIFAQLHGESLGTAADRSFTLLILLPFLVGGIAAWFDDRPQVDGNAAARSAASSAKALLQGVVLVFGLLFVLRSWGVDPLAGADGGVEDRIAKALLEAGGAVIVGWALWRGVASLLDRFAPGGGDGAHDDEGMGKTGSRLDTLVPLLRSAALGVIVIISALTALAALGINITALLAGAGVIGLAVGFGAQTLVKDVITGIFYLVEDAFRVGEYVVTESGKGVVEKISLRSVRLRHHRGPVYTIPFGTLGTVQNHSRDWVKIKLMLRVPFDTDIEQVRRLIKRVGIEMLEAPGMAEHFIAPIKSQGVLDVDDSAMIIGVKFICKPGEQFVIRRETYARIQKAFAENDIDFAPKRVIVESDSDEFAKARAGAAAAAAAHTGDAGLDAAS